MWLNIVTHEELLTAQIVKITLLCLMGAGIIFNVIRITQIKETHRRIISFGILLILCIIASCTARQYYIDASLLKYPRYVRGVTIGYCDVLGLGQGVEFEYEVNGQVFRNCNTYYPISKDSIIVPNGKYAVRFSYRFTEDGRMDFKKQLP